MFVISKKFEFCYGHRVYSQNCNVKYAIEDDNPCRRIHGHQGSVSVAMEADKLDNRSFVIDFKELTFIKKFIDYNLDHRFILSYNDPRFEKLACASVEKIKEIATPISLLGEFTMGWRSKDTELDSFVFVDFNPTSENLAKWIFEAVESIIEHSPFACSVKEVIWSETPKTQAVYHQEYRKSRRLLGGNYDPR